MDLYNKQFWKADFFDEAFRKCSQYPLDQKENYLRNTYIAYRLMIKAIRKRQPEAKKLLDYGSGFGIGWLICTMEGFSVHCADIGNLLDFFPARYKYTLPDELEEIKKMRWDVIYLVGILSYIPLEDLGTFLDSLLSFNTKGLYLMGWIEGKTEVVYNRHGVKGHVYQRKEAIPLLKRKGFEIIENSYPTACYLK